MTVAILARKVADILARIERVRELLPESQEVFEAQRTPAEALILNLYLALQASSDLALHVAADRGLGVPAGAREAYEVLARAAASAGPGAAPVGCGGPAQPDRARVRHAGPPPGL